MSGAICAAFLCFIKIQYEEDRLLPAEVFGGKRKNSTLKQFEFTIV